MLQQETLAQESGGIVLHAPQHLLHCLLIFGIELRGAAATRSRRRARIAAQQIAQARFIALRLSLLCIGLAAGVTVLLSLFALPRLLRPLVLLTLLPFLRLPALLFFLLALPALLALLGLLAFLRLLALLTL